MRNLDNHRNPDCWNQKVLPTPRKNGFDRARPPQLGLHRQNNRPKPKRDRDLIVKIRYLFSFVVEGLLERLNLLLGNDLLN